MATAIIDGIVVTGTVDEISQLIKQHNLKYTLTGGTMPSVGDGIVKATKPSGNA